MQQTVTELCLLQLTASHAVVNIFVLSSKVHAENFSRRYICVRIHVATTVDFSIQVQMNQWKIVAPGLDKFDLLSEAVSSLVRVS